MTLPRHRSVILSRLFMVLDCPVDHDRDMTDRCSRLFHGGLGDEIVEAVYQAQRSHGLPAVIERLVIDVKDMPLEAFERALPDRLLEQLRQQLAEYGTARSHRTSSASDTPPTVALAVGGGAGEDMSEPALFDHYLHKGYWPSQALRSVSADLDGDPDVWVNAQYAVAPLVWKPLIARACLTKKTRRRLMDVLSAHTLHRCVDIVGEVTPATVLLAALRFFQQHPECDFPPPERGEDLPAISLTQDNESQLAQLFARDTAPALARWLNALLLQPPLRAWAENRSLVYEYQPAPSGRDVGCPSVPEPLRSQKRGDGIQAQERPERRMASAARPRMPVIGHGNDNVAQTVSGHAAPLVAWNAGLVLLWPLLPDLFTRLGLWQKNRFIGRDAQINAACWLDAAIWSEDCAKAWRMGMTRYLCGLPLDSEIMETRPADDVADTLQNWWHALPLNLPGWRTLGVQDIKSLFIRRPGELAHLDSAPILRVQREPFDILLNDWPWPMDALMLPWLERPLSIHWL